MIYIYEIKNIINNKVYIGQTKNINSRFKDHKYRLKVGKHGNDRLQYDYDLYGLHAFTFNILCYTQTQYEADLLESKYIFEHGGVNSGNVYNHLTGGLKGYHESKETHNKKVEQHLGEKNHMFGKCRTIEECDKISKTRIERKVAVGSNNPRAKAVICINTLEEFGSASEAHVATGVRASSIRACCRGIYKSASKMCWMYLDEWKLLDDIQKTNKKQFALTNFFGSGSSKAKKVICIETMEMYTTIKEAAKDKNLFEIDIINCCKDKCETAGNYHWMYYDKYLIMKGEI